ncbi:MAG: hypothetical protein ACYDD2_01135 [Candidatus Acidiferrales bacterium]
MKNSMSRSVAEFLRRAMLVAVCGVFLGGAAYAQGGSCTVNQIRVRIGTAAQHPLAGTVNNIDLEIHFIGGTIQKAPDVNANMTWGVNSQNVVTIPLNQPVPVTKIKRIRLIYNISAGEWDMSFLRARAIGSVWNGRIAAWGSDPNPSPHRFTATYPAFGVDTVIPANACNLARMPVAGPVRLAPGVAAQNPARGSGPLLPSSRPQGMLVQQSSPALLQQARPVNAQATIQRNSSPGMVGPAQTMSATGNSGGSRALMTQAGPATAQSAVKPLQPRTSQSSESSWQPLVQRGTGQGVIEGYVYWDGRIQHVPPADCSGLALTVSAGETSLGTFTNNFAYIQNVGTYGVCAYAVHQVPVGQDLQVQISVTAPGAFSPEILRVGGSRSIKIIGGRCNNLPPAVPSPSALSSNWWTCGNYAYNVNFILDAGPRERFAPGAEVGVRKPSPPRQNVNMANGGAKADDLNPQPYPPKGNASRSAFTDGNRSALSQATLQKNITQGTVGSSQTMNAPGNAGAAAPQSQQVRIARRAMPPLPAAVKAKLGPPKKVQPIKNLGAIQANAALIGLLHTQRQSANAEAARMANLVARSQTQPTILGQQSQLMSANGSRVTTASAQAPPQAINAGTSTQAHAPATRTMLARPTAVQTVPRTGSVGNIGPSRTSSASGNASGTLMQPGSVRTQSVNGSGSGSPGNISSSVAQLPHIDTTVLTCAHNPTMRILNVSGSSFPATFTPIAQENFYTITGCSFGNTGPIAKVYIYKGATFREEFQIQEWSDNWIKLNLDSNLSGLLDQDNLTLVVQRADGQQTSKDGFKFYAAREKRLLTQIPNSYFGLYGLNIVDTSQWSQSYNSPASTTDGYGFGGMTAEVSIGEGLQFIKGNFDTQDMPSPGTDIYDLSHLQPGFAATEADISSHDMGCSGGGGTLITSGTLGGEFNGSQLWINWPGENCKNVSCGNGGLFSTDCFINPFVYAVDVWVEGPRGVDPWTGLPTKP